MAKNILTKIPIYFVEKHLKITLNTEISILEPNGKTEEKNEGKRKTCIFCLFSKKENLKNFLLA